MPYAIAYLTTLVVYAGLDAVWLSVMGKLLYRPALGDMLLPTLNVPPAIAFYLVYPAGLSVFAVAPALRGGSFAASALYAVLFGAIAYATYDLTNYATLKNWTLQITLADIAWGAFASLLASSVAIFVVRHFN